MKTGRIVKSPDHLEDSGRWLECYPTAKECELFKTISPDDRTYCNTVGHTGQSPRLVRLEVARKKGWVE